MLALLASCSSKFNERCVNSICLDVTLEKQEEHFLVKMVFHPNIDTLLYLDEQMFVIGCPLYEENINFFEGVTPTLEELKFSQIILENEDGDYRVFSSQLFDKDKPSVIKMPNCTFMNTKKVDLKNGQSNILEFSIDEKTDILVKEADKKVLVHLYYKDLNGRGYIIRSANWLSVEN